MFPTLVYQPPEHGRSIPLAEPYVVSFCTHTNQRNYVKENGLLSQWRTDGDKGGFALIFDTRRIEEWMEIEPNNYHYAGWYLGEVVYDDQENPFSEEFADLANILDTHLRALADGGQPIADK